MLVVLGMLSAFAPMSLDLYLPAFPSMAAHFGTTTGTVQLSLSASLAGLAIGQAFYGPISDRYGRRKPLLVGVVLFTVASLACAVAPSIGWLIALRFIQALGGCAGIVISRAMVRDQFHGSEAARVFSLLMLVFGLAPVLAPLIGGQLLLVFEWQAVFVLLAAFGVACFFGAWTLAETLPQERRRVGGFGAALRTYGEVARDRSFVLYAAIGGLGSAALFTYISSSPAVIIDEYGVGAQSFGLVFGLNSLGFVAMSQLNARLLRTQSPARLLRWAVMLQAAAGTALLGVALTGVGGLAGLMAPMFLTVACIGAINPNAAALALEPFPHAAGSAAALLGTSQQVLGALAAAVVGWLAWAPAREMGAVVFALTLTGLGLVLVAVPRLRSVAVTG